MHRKHIIDPGSEVTEGSRAWGVGGIPVRYEVPLLQKSYNVPPRLQHSCTAPTPDFRDLVRRLSNRFCDALVVLRCAHERNEGAGQVYFCMSCYTGNS